MIYILSDHIETGKSSALLKWTKARKDVFGILTPRNENNIRYVLDVNTKECFEMQADPEASDVINVGRYRFLKTAFTKGNNIIKIAVKNNKSGYIIIDELGKLELESKGFYEVASLAISKTITHQDLHLILVIRSSLLLPMLKKLNMTDYQLIAVENLSQPGKLNLKNSDHSFFEDELL